MRKQLVVLTLAALLGAVGSHALQYWLVPAPAHADGISGDFGRALLHEDGTFVVTAQDSVLTFLPDGTVTVRAPHQVIIGAADDVKIEGYRIKLDASGDIEIEGSSLNIDVYDYENEANRIELGTSSSEVTLADGDEYVALSDDGEIVKSQRVKAR
ncbi:MAG TPA: hypothetical protein QGH10_21195 [Armatimonadota bacterium]|nr:hypothetical protein [Armatimonadota bacterium]